MALAKTYLTVNGKIRSEQRAGEAHSRDYVLDRLGSVIQIYQNGWPIADACYEPYGGIYTQWNMEGKTFTWLGGWGYRQTGVEWSSVYVRARHYSRGMSNWTSIDPLWPSEMAYGYVEGRVMAGVDPSGMQAIFPSPIHGGSPGRFGLTPPESMYDCCDPVLRKKWNQFIYQYCNKCYWQKYPDETCRRNCNMWASGYYRLCKGEHGPGNWRPGLDGQVFPWKEPPFFGFGGGTPTISSKKPPLPTISDSDPCRKQPKTIQNCKDCGAIKAMAFMGTISGGVDVQPPNGIAIFTSSCNDCCAKNGLGLSCHSECNVTAFTMGQFYAGTVAGDEPTRGNNGRPGGVRR